MVGDSLQAGESCSFEVNRQRGEQRWWPPRDLKCLCPECENV